MAALSCLSSLSAHEKVDGEEEVENLFMYQKKISGITLNLECRLYDCFCTMEFDIKSCIFSYITSLCQPHVQCQPQSKLAYVCCLQ